MTGRPAGDAAAPEPGPSPAARAAAGAAPRRRSVSPDALRLPIIRDAAPEAASRAAARAVWRSLGPGELILDFNDRSTDVYFVVEGAVRVQLRTSGGRELILNEIAAGGMFGEIAAIDGEPRTANVTATVASRLCVLPADAFLDAACSAPAACLALLRMTTAILRRQSSRVVEREALPVRLRLAAELLRLSRRRRPAGEGDGSEERIVSPPPVQHELAARIGARREVVSRELAGLVRRGLVVKVRGGIVLPRPEALREAIGARFGLDPARIVCGNGSDEIIQHLILAYGGEGTELVMSQHGFVMYDISGRYAGCRVIKAPERNLTADVDAMLAAVGPRTKLVFLANPNNPTGSMLPASEVARLRAGLREDILLVLDAAYAEYVTDPAYDPGVALVDGPGGNTVMTRTFSKIFGLGGARLGWAYAPAALIDILNRVRGPFNVNAAAMAAGIAAVNAEGWVRCSVEHNTELHKDGE